jgi:hypothetical protein
MLSEGQPLENMYQIIRGRVASYKVCISGSEVRPELIAKPRVC